VTPRRALRRIRPAPAVSVSSRRSSAGHLRMDRLLWGILEFLDFLTLGTLRRWGAADPDELRDEARRRDADRLERDGLVQSRGIASTPLCPSGKVEVRGRTYDAVSREGYIDRGSPIEVVEIRGFSLVVRVGSTS
jgi:membrane protein implicated in regulation of membrane protease activity